MATPLYQQVARLIETQINRGTLACGDRAPSVRALARSAGVSIATVNQAYQQLEQLGLLHARPRSGYFVAAPAHPPAPIPVSRKPRAGKPGSVAGEAIDTLLESMRRPDVLALGSAATQFSGRLNARLNRLTRQVLRECPQIPNVLSTPPGEERLRRAVAQRLSLSGTAVDPEHVVITAGTMEAITLSLSVLCRDGDTVLLESPTYFGVLQVVEHLGLKVVEVANRPGSGIDVDAVAEVAGREKIQAAVLMPNFNNPTGALTSDADKARLTQILGTAGIPIIEDDIYGDLHLTDERPRPLATFPATGSVITCGSVSKSMALGYRIGWAVSPEYADDIARAKFCTSLACPTLQQRVLACYFEEGGYDRYLRQLRMQLLQDRIRYQEAIVRYFPAGTRVSNPEGGVVLWVQLPEGTDGLVLFRHALADRIGIAPGLIFSARAGYRNFIRVTMGAGWNDRIEGAIRKLGRLAGN